MKGLASQHFSKNNALSIGAFLVFGVSRLFSSIVPIADHSGPEVVVDEMLAVRRERWHSPIMMLGVGETLRGLPLYFAAGYRQFSGVG